MLNYLLKRLLLMIPTLIGMTIVVFVIIRIAPGSPEELATRSESGDIQVEARDRNLEEMRKSMGLDKPWYEQYFRWVAKVGRLDFGDSLIQKRPVMDMIGERVGLTILLNALSLTLMYIISIPIGLIAARNRERGGIRQLVFDTGSGMVLLVMYSLPSIFVGTILLTLVAQGGILDTHVQQLQTAGAADSAAALKPLVMPIDGISSEGAEQFPLLRYLVDVAWHLVLPVITLTIGGLAAMSKQARTSLLENLRQDYVRTARAKGVKERTVVYGHALRNSLLPLLTLIGGILPALIGGSLIVETIFGLPGMGTMMWDAVRGRDYTVIQGVSLISAALTLLAILITDMLYAVADPRIRYD